MNAWDVDSNLQLSVYTEIGHRIVLLFNKLRDSLVRRVAQGERRPKIKKQRLPNIPAPDQIPYCCLTPFKEIAENHRLYYPIPHVF